MSFTSVSKKWTLSYPSKTFLIGEYAVLYGTPAVLINTNPSFQFHVQQDSLSPFLPFNEDSPAYVFSERNKNIFSNVSIETQDPHQGQGGFGLSSAEFNCVYDIFLKRNHFQQSLSQIWNIYRSLSKGSGADIISQRVKGLCVFHPKPFQAQSLRWPFCDLSFALIRAGERHKTFEHLENLNLKAFPLLTKMSLRAVESVYSAREDIFIDCLIQYSEILDQLSLMADRTYRLIQEFKKNKDILCSKGCGAMGAEVMAVFFKKNKEKKVLKFLKSFRVEAQYSDINYGNSSSCSQ